MYAIYRANYVLEIFVLKNISTEGVFFFSTHFYTVI